MPRTKSEVQQSMNAPSQAQDKLAQFEAGDSARVWWPPTDDEEKTDYAGMFWPVKILSINGTRVDVQYDNGEVETVQSEHLQPAEPPVDFGKEAVHLQTGEFVEVHNQSKQDPAAWLGKVHKVHEHFYTVAYPFHDAKNERIAPERVRRARLFERETSQWKIIKPGQTWADGEIESPVELETVTAKELAALFQARKVATEARMLKAAKADKKIKADADLAAAAKKRKASTPQRAGT